MVKNGIGETGEFQRCHPSLNFIYFMLIVCVTMFSTHPLFLGLSYIFSWIYSVVLRGSKAMKFNLILLPFMAVVTVLNMLLTHNGATVLFYLNEQRITAEAGWYGLASSVMFASVLIWFSCFQVVLTTDKFLYLFGRIVPAIALTISMVMRYIPLLKRRFEEVAAGQRCMGRDRSGMSFLGKIRQAAKEISIVISWSLEASIETGDSMEARGYGLKGRTSFHLYHFTRQDFHLLRMQMICGVIVIAEVVAGGMNMYYYPQVQFHGIDATQIVTAVVYAGFMGLPIGMDIYGQKKWDQEQMQYETDH